jgi:hypothetical protein
MRSCFVVGMPLINNYEQSSYTFAVVFVGQQSAAAVSVFAATRGAYNILYTQHG